MGEKVPVIAEVAGRVGWARLWDAALDSGGKTVRGMQVLSYIKYVLHLSSRSRTAADFMPCCQHSPYICCFHFNSCVLTISSLPVYSKALEQKFSVFINFFAM